MSPRTTTANSRATHRNHRASPGDRLSAKRALSIGTLVSIVAVASAVFSIEAFAQSSKSDVELDTAVLSSTAVLGSKAEQKVDLGNASKGGQAKVKGRTAVIANTGVLGSQADQTTKIGNADGSNSKSNVTFDTLVQSNTAVLGSKAKQELELGNAANGGTSTVKLKTAVVANQAVLGSQSNQTVRVGNAK